MFQFFQNRKKAQLEQELLQAGFALVNQHGLASTWEFPSTRICATVMRRYDHRRETDGPMTVGLTFDGEWGGFAASSFEESKSLFLESMNGLKEADFEFFCDLQEDYRKAFGLPIVSC